MTTGFITHPDCLNHVTPEGHPERVARLEAILEKTASAEFASLMRIEAARGTPEQVTLAHPQEHYERIATVNPQDKHVALDADTHMSSGSFEAAMRGVGAICQAVDLVIADDVQNVFCAMRPPGHHAEKTTPMGFCLFGNVAIGAKHALAKHGLSRVAIVDFDVHHGNGTQDLVWDDEQIFFASTHEMPLYPGTGSPSETGAHGNVMNIPFNAGARGDVLIKALRDQIIPALEGHRPEMLFISAGFDAHQADPLANLNFQTEDFALATQMLCDFAKNACDGRVVSTLEGGYDLDALAASTAAHLRVLMEYGT